MNRPICFLSDFGLEDAYVGVVKGAILTVDPSAQVVDLSHAVAPQDIRAGAFRLMTAVPYFPVGTVYLAVVDPGVGSQRRAIAVRAGGSSFVGPDNGLLSWAVARAGRLAGIPLELDEGRLRLGGTADPTTADGRGGVTAVTLTQPRFWRTPLSATFHGRDLFGPVAAHLARGVSLAELGDPIDAIASLPMPMPSRGSGERRGVVIYVDRYGNLVTNLERADVAADAIIGVGGRTIRGLSGHFQQASDLIAVVGSNDVLEIAVPNGSAAAALGLGVGAPVTIFLS